MPPAPPPLSMRLAGLAFGVLPVASIPVAAFFFFIHKRRAIDIFDFATLATYIALLIVLGVLAARPPGLSRWLTLPIGIVPSRLIFSYVNSREHVVFFQVYLGLCVLLALVAFAFWAFARRRARRLGAG